MTTDILSFQQAGEFVSRYHRHNKKPVGHKFSIGCWDKGELLGVAMCGRPVARKLDNGETIEIYRVCTKGHRNACSKLYSACVRRAKKLGYKKVITYTLQSENGSSVKASNFIIDAQKAGGLSWNGRTAFKGVQQFKRRWAFIIQ